MQKKYCIADIVSVAVLVFNAVCVVCFLFPPGRVYYMPEFLVRITMLLSTYVIFGGLGISGIIGIVLNVISILLKRNRGVTFRSNIIFLVLFALSLPCAWFAFQAAMSV